MMDVERVAVFGGIKTAFPTLTKIASFFPIPIFREVYVSGERIVDYAGESMERYRRHVIAEPSNPKSTLFTQLFREGEESLSDDEIKSEGQAYIIGGSDTTAITLTYLVWSVCRNSEIKQRLVEELAPLREDFRDQDLRSLPYLNRVITETFRLYAVAPSALPREVPPGGAMLAGYFIPGGLTVATQAYTLHRDPTIFLQPEKFDPSRWVAPTKSMKDAFMPFGGGSRSKCSFLSTSRTPC
jgi:cytochrome P450